MITSKEFTFLSYNNVTNVFCKMWYCNDKEPNGIIQISHGMCEHIQRYHALAEYLAEKGFLVVGNDHLGHGKTAACEDDLGYFGDEITFEYCVRDIYNLMVVMKKRYPHLPYVFLGHSMGSFFVRYFMYMLRKGYFSNSNTSAKSIGLDGVILLGTAGDVPFLNTVITIFKNKVSKNGGRHRTTTTADLALMLCNFKLGRNTKTHDWTCSVPEVIEDIKNDKLCNYIFTDSACIELVNCLRLVNTKDVIDAFDKNVPLYMLSGSNDPIGEYSIGVKLLLKKFEFYGKKNIKLKIYKNARHELVNEVCKDEVYKDIEKFCNKIVDKKIIL